MFFVSRYVGVCGPVGQNSGEFRDEVRRERKTFGSVAAVCLCRTRFRLRTAFHFRQIRQQAVAFVG